jgi:predicted nucleic-acid-binding Zn-ribbon protein
MENKTCPKCGGEMACDRHLGSYTEIMLKKGEQFLGDWIKVFYCVNCGFIELYREKREHDGKERSTTKTGSALAEPNPSSE